MHGLTSTQRVIFTIMKKHLTIICSLACLIGFIAVILGCDQPADKPASPKVVRKKIHTQTAQKGQPAKKQSQKKSRPKAKPAVKQADTGKPARQQPMIAKKSAPSATTSGKTVKSKPPVKPKSDISVARPPSISTSGDKAGSDPKAMASTTPAGKTRSLSMPPPMYNPKGKIDPFEPLFREKPVVAAKKSKRKKRTPRTPLEKIDISQLKLVAIILAASGNRALVEESSGKGYVVKKGTYMGTNSGKVIKIEKNKVIVAEEFEDNRGNVTQRNREIKLPKPPGEL